MSDTTSTTDDLPQTITIDEFTSDSVAVQESRQFLASKSGRKLLAALRGQHPLRSLITKESQSPAIIREASRLEGEASSTLLGKIEGFEIALTTLSERLLIPRQKSDPKSRRAGREILPASASIPTR